GERWDSREAILAKFETRLVVCARSTGGRRNVFVVLRSQVNRPAPNQSAPTSPQAFRVIAHIDENHSTMNDNINDKGDTSGLPTAQEASADNAEDEMTPLKICP
ncbi:hypothetical protein FRC01_008232, partial [Tulasnella sp. 417]